ncbi:RNA methyltransferase [Myxococcota bacterium]|nr:RNA methyltransferase [Myxococcota bacterium]
MHSDADRTLDPPAPLIRDDRKERVAAALSTRLGSVVVVCEAVHRRHNVSAILRSAEAFGVHEVHLVTGPFRPSKGAARGAERWLELHRHKRIEACLGELKARGYRIFVADLDEAAHSPDTLPVDQPLVILFGAEHSGVSDQARALADGTVTVPMRGLTESLNVSVAAACVLQRVSERRRARVGKGDLEPARQQAFFDAWVAAEEEEKAGRRARRGEPGGGDEAAPDPADPRPA